MGIPAITTGMKIFTVIHPTDIFIEIITKRSIRSVHLRGRPTARAKVGRTSASFGAQGGRVCERATDGAGQDLVACEVPTYQREVDHRPVQFLVEALNEHSGLC